MIKFGLIMIPLIYLYFRLESKFSRMDLRGKDDEKMDQKKPEYSPAKAGLEA